MFEGTEPIFEKKISDGRVRSYVYALGNHLARVDGVIGDTTAKKYWYHTDHVGSVKSVTNQAGDEVWKADYLPFGTQYMKNKLDSEFEEDDLGFTGKCYDKDAGLYYFNARWYDADTGRFTSEDPAADSNNPNNYSYCANNPLSNTDPTGLYIAADGSDQVGPPAPANLGGTPPTGGPGAGGPNSTNKYRNDGTLKSSRTIENNTQTTVYYDKEGNVTRVSVFDNTGMQTITSYREGIPRSVITFNSRGDITGYSKIPAPIAPRSVTAADYFQFYYQPPLTDEYNSSAQGIQAEQAMSPLAPVLLGYLGFGLTNPDEGIDQAIANGLSAGLMFYGAWELYAAYQFYQYLNGPIFYHAVPGADIGQSVLNGINLRYVDAANRFGKAFYITQQPETAVAELAYHQKIATHLIRYDVNLANQKVLNLANPKVAREWGFTTNASVATCQQIAVKAQGLGFNVIAFPSYRGPGINLAVYNNFNQTLSPQMVVPGK